MWRSRLHGKGVGARTFANTPWVSQRCVSELGNHELRGIRWTRGPLPAEITRSGQRGPGDGSLLPRGLYRLDVLGVFATILVPG